MRANEPKNRLETFRGRRLILQSLIASVGGICVASQSFATNFPPLPVDAPNITHELEQSSLLVKVKPYATLGGRDFYDPEQILSLDLSLFAMTDGDLVNLVRFRKLKSLNLVGSKVTAKTIFRLQNLDELETLDLNNCASIDDAAIRWLPKLKRLKTLSLAGTQITDKGVQVLSKCPQIEHLVISGIHISTNGLRSLQKMPSLRRLCLSSVRNLNSEDMSAVAAIPGLEELSLSIYPNSAEAISQLEASKKLRKLEVWSNEYSNSSPDGTRLSPAHYTAIAKIKSLEELYFYQNDVTSSDLLLLKPLTNLEHLHCGLYDGADNKLAILSCFPNLRSLNLDGSDISDRGLSAIQRMSKLRNLYLGNCRISDEALISLSKLKCLEELTLHETPIGDAGLKHLKDLVNLRLLHLDRTKITDTGLRELSMLTKLTNLSMGWTKITDQGLAALKNFSQLRSLYLYQTEVGESGSPVLSELKSLQNLSLGRTKTNDESVQRLSMLPHLEDLNIGNTRCTDRGVTFLSKANRLKKLNIGGNSIFNVTALSNMSKLESLDIEYTEILFNDYQRLRYALPDCSITSNYNTTRCM